MKGRFSPASKFSDRQFLALWIAFHLGMAVFFAAALFRSGGKVKVDADLFNMLPKPIEAKSISVADDKLTDLTAQGVFILARNEDFSKAKAAAEKVYLAIKDSPKFESVEFYSDLNSLRAAQDFLFQHRWNLLGNGAIDRINASPAQFSLNSLSKIYSGFTVFPLDNIDSDPFLVSEAALEGYLSSIKDSGVAVSPKDGVLASSLEGNWYVMVRGTMSREGSALASDKNAVVEIYDACSRAAGDGTEFVFSGTPFHSHKSSTSAAREIKIISAVSLAVVLALLLAVFRSPVPIMLTLGSIGISVAVSFSAVMGFFGKIHILTLIFGTSLIGSCIDYSLHFFISWKGNPALGSGREIRGYLFSGLFFSLASTEICYLILVFAPFGLLKQMAVFSLFGIFSSFLTVVCVYPLLPVPKNRNIPFVSRLRLPSWYNRRTAGRIAVCALFAFSIACVALGFRRISIRNDIASLYTMDGRILSDEIEAFKVLQYRPSAWFIISGGSEQEVLEREEGLAKKLRALDAESGTGGFMCASQFVPSIASQKRSREACRKLLDDSVAVSQFAALGVDDAWISAAKLREEFLRSESDFVEMRNIPDFLAASISTVWLGEIGGKFYSVLVMSRSDKLSLVEGIADGDDNIFYVQKVKSISSDLDYLTALMLKLFLAAYAVIFAVLRMFYRQKQTLKIVSIPLLMVLMVATCFALMDMHLEFFSIAGMILVFGLGLDYVIYMVEHEKRGSSSEYDRLEPFAILLSFVTTAVSFGALAMSQFKPVHLMGLSIFIGLVTAYATSFFYSRSKP